MENKTIISINKKEPFNILVVLEAQNRLALKKVDRLVYRLKHVFGYSNEFGYGNAITLEVHDCFSLKENLELLNIFIGYLEDLIEFEEAEPTAPSKEIETAS